MKLQMYLLRHLGISIVTDHEPRLFRGERMRLKVQGFAYTVTYNPTDYISRHPISNTKSSKEEKKKDS